MIYTALTCALPYVISVLVYGCKPVRNWLKGEYRASTTK